MKVVVCAIRCVDGAYCVPHSCLSATARIDALPQCASLRSKEARLGYQICLAVDDEVS